MKKTDKKMFTVLVWNENEIIIRRNVSEDRVDRMVADMQTTIRTGDPDDDDDDPRWQAWEGYAKVTVI